MIDDLSDSLLEAKIRHALDLCLLEKNQKSYRVHWLRLTELIAQRSKTQVCKMEKEMGLA